MNQKKRKGAFALQNADKEMRRKISDFFDFEKFWKIAKIWENLGKLGKSRKIWENREFGKKKLGNWGILENLEKLGKIGKL